MKYDDKGLIDKYSKQVPLLLVALVMMAEIEIESIKGK